MKQKILLLLLFSFLIGCTSSEFDKQGIHKRTKTRYGYNKDGYNKMGYDKNGLNKDGFSEEALKFHNAAWFEYFDLDPTSFEVYNLTYDANDRERVFYSLKPKPIEVEMKNAKGLRKYRKNIIIKEIDAILENDNFKSLMSFFCFGTKY